MNQERRFTSGRKPTFTKRADGKTIISGYAAVFFRSSDPGTEYDLGYGIRERIAPTAFNRALQEQQDVAARFDHAELLGRSTAGTLRMKVDDVGLYYEIDVPDTQCGRDTATLIERGDIPGSSFAFRATQVQWLDQGEAGEVRNVQDCDLYDVGPVVFPAYTATTTGVRSTTPEGMESVKAERDEWRSSQAPTPETTSEDEIAVRLALIALDD